MRSSAWSKANVFDPSVTQLLIPGPVQSGKTLSAVFFFLSWAAKNWSGYEFALCSRSMRQYSAVLSKYAREFGVLTGLGWSAVADHHEMKSAHGNLPNKFYLGLGSDISSEAKVRGWTLAGALLDEVTLMPEDFVNTVLGPLFNTRRQGGDVLQPRGADAPRQTQVHGPAGKRRDAGAFQAGRQPVPVPGLHRRPQRPVHRRHETADGLRRMGGDVAALSIPTGRPRSARRRPSTRRGASGSLETSGLPPSRTCS